MVSRQCVFTSNLEITNSGTSAVKQYPIVANMNSLRRIGSHENLGRHSTSGVTEFFHPQSDLQINLGNQGLKNAIGSLRLSVFLLTNDLADENIVQEFLRNIMAVADLEALRSFLLRPGEVADAVAEKLFPHAIKLGNTDLVKYLLERGLKPDDFTVGDAVALYDEVTWTKIFGNAHMRYDQMQMTPLAFACHTGNVELVRVLLDAHADVNKALTCEYPRYLCFGEPEIDVICLTPLCLAINQSRVHDFSIGKEPANKVVRMLLEAHAHVNPSLNVLRVGYVLPLSQAAIAGDSATLKLLIESGADINRTDWYGDTALAKALEQHLDKPGLETALKVLIQAGADLKVTEDCLHQRRFEVRDELVTLGPKIAIDYVARGGNIELFELIWNIDPTTSEQTIDCAVQSGNLHLVRRLLQTAAGDPILGKTFTGYELAGALEKGRLEIAELLIQCKIIPCCEKSMETTFKKAIETKQRGIIEQLWAIAENQDDWDLSSIANVAAAISTGQYDIAENLINCGGRVSANALTAAVKTGDKARVQKVLKVYEDSFESVLEVLNAATELGNPEILEIILDFGFMPRLDDVEIVRCIDAAVKNKRRDLLCMLLGAGARPNCARRTVPRQNLSPLALAARRSDIVEIRMLLDVGADPEDAAALWEATRNANLDAIRELLEAYLRSNKTCTKGYGCEALNNAIRRGHLEMVHVLLSHGVCPNILYSDGRNAMGVAIESGSKSLSILREFLSARMDPNAIVIADGTRLRARTALIHAIVCKNLPAVKLLIDSDADVNLPATRRTRKTPLQAACEIGYLDAVRLLLDHGADINALPADVRGATALQFAAIGGHVGIASVLIEGEADLDAAAAKVQGRTALEGAAENGRFDMVKLLLNAGVCITGSGEKQYLRALKFASEKKHRAVRKVLESASTNMYIASST